MKSFGGNHNAIFRAVVCILISDVRFTRADRSTRCQDSENPRVYPDCMLSPFESAIWCSQSAYTRIPQPDDHEGIKRESAIGVSIMYINTSCLTDIAKGDLEKYSSLKFFVGYDNFLTKLKGEIFLDNEKLEKINLGRNEIESFEADTFKGLKHLRHLNLSDNKIDSIPKGAWNDLSSLETLCLDRNKLYKIQRYYFRNLINLKVLHLRENKIAALYGPFNLANLEELVLDRNEIRTVDNRTFSELPKLRRLSLPFNEIRKWPEYYGKILTTLEVLDLSANYIREFTSNHLEQLGKLRYLALNNNSLARVREDLFVPTVNLQFLNLSLNDLKGIPENAFESLRNLEVLSLSNNELVTPHKRWFHQLGKQRNPKVEIHGNEWKCECGIVEFQRYVTLLSKNNTELAGQLAIKCSSPKSMKGQILEKFRAQDIILDLNCEFSRHMPTTTSSDEENFSSDATTLPSPVKTIFTVNGATHKENPRIYFITLPPEYLINDRPQSESERNLIAVVVSLSAILVIVVVAVFLCRRHFTAPKRRLDSTNSTTPFLRELHKLPKTASELQDPFPRQTGYFDGQMSSDSISPASFELDSHQEQYYMPVTEPKQLYTSTDNTQSSHRMPRNSDISRNDSLDSFRSCKDPSSDFHSSTSITVPKTTGTGPPSSIEFHSIISRGVPDGRGCPDGAEVHTTC